MNAWIMTLLLTAARTLGGGLDAHPAPATVADAWAAVEARAGGAAEAVAPPQPAAGPGAAEAGRGWASPRAYERFLVGLVALERGDTATAVRALREARLLDPEAAPVRRCLTEALRRSSSAGAADAAGRPGPSGGRAADCAAGAAPGRLAPRDPAP